MTTRGLHPYTRPQRAKVGEHGWASPPEGERIETRDAPAGGVAKGIAWVFATLLVSMGAVAGLVLAIESRAPIPAAVAAGRFITEGPPLLAAPERWLHGLGGAHPPPAAARIERAMREVEREGWGEAEPPPGRAAIALERAEALE